MKKRNEQIFVRVMKNGYIQQLGICGPIPNPIKVSRAVAHSMVVGGVEVHEVDPVTKMTKKLTIHNVFSDDVEERSAVTHEHITPNPAPNKPVETVTLSGTAVQAEETVKEAAPVEAEAEATEEVVETVEETVVEEKTTQKQNGKGKGKKNK